MYRYIPLLFYFFIIVDRKLWFFKREGHVQYDKSKVYAGTEEFQFEEIRAAKYMAILKQGLPLPKDVNRSKKEKNRVAQVEKKERVMYPKDRVYTYEGEFQLEEVMAKPYYERGNRLRMENKTKSSKVLIDNEVAHNAAAAHITIRNSAKKSHSLRNVEEFRVAEDNADNCPPPATFQFPKYDCTQW